MNELVRDLESRRNDRFESMSLRLKDFYEISRIYPSKEARLIMDNIMDAVDKVSQKHSFRNGELKSYSRWINIDKSEYDEFINNIIDNVRNAQEICVEYMLKETEDELTQAYIHDNINNIEKNSRDKYFQAVKLLVRLDKIGKITELENNLYELKKDLISCLKYNDKIKKAEKE